MIIVFLTLSAAYIMCRVIEFQVEYDHSKTVLGNVPKFSSLSEEFKEKVDYLQKKNEELSSKLKIKPPTLYMVDNNEDQVTAVNWLFFKGVLWEKNTLQGLNKEALGAVLAHELFHIKSYHYLKGKAIQSVLTVLGLLVLSVMLHGFVEAQPKETIMFWAFVSVFSFLGLVKLLEYFVITFDNYISRQEELDCDRFAIESEGSEFFKAEAAYFKQKEEEWILRNPSKRWKPVKAIRSIIYNTHPSWEERLELTKGKP